MAAAALCSRLVLEVRRARGKADAAGVVLPGGLEGWMARTIPWGAIGLFAWVHELGPRLSSAGAEPTYALSVAASFFLVVVSLLLAVGQATRRSALRQSRGELGPRAARGWLRAPSSSLPGSAADVR